MVAPSTQTLLTEWGWEPSIVIGLILFTAAYAYVAGPLRRKHNLGPPLGRTQIALFVTAQLVLIIALLSPLDAIGDAYLFSAHMVQHLLLAALWPPLILLATPAWMVRPILHQPVLGSFAAMVTAPVLAISLFTLDMYFWHLPYFYDLTLQSEQIHIVEHLSFLAFGVINWWPILSPLREQRLNYPLQVLYLFADGMLMMALAIVLTFSPIVFYTPYESAPRLWGMSVLTDQSVGGLIMWYPGNLPYGVWLIIAFYRWFNGEGSSERERAWIESSTTHG